ncbi:MAG: hypothetical protein D6806_03395 [Deltaproteobacteria bacterium]|nr:MAG: hypothetical protein D6806_03395 [Deltaproteobacteria bacterium]
MKRAAIVPLAVALVAIGCGGSGGGGSEVTIDQLAGKMAAAYCAKAYQCCNQEELAQLQGEDFTDEASCTTYYTSLIEQFLVTPMRSAIDAGRGSYDAAKAGKCIDAFEALGCTGSNDPNTFFDNCETPYVGLQGEGAECANNLECQSGLYCSSGKTCSAYLSSGETCGGNSEPYCGQGLYCDTGTTTCTQMKNVGDDCTSAVECSTFNCDDTTHKCVERPQVCTGQ